MPDPDDGGDGATGLAVEGVTDGDDAHATVTVEGHEVPLRLSDELVEAAEANEEVSLEELVRSATPTGDVDFSVHAQTDAGESVTIPVKDVRDFNLTSSRFSSAHRFTVIGDDRITKLEQNSVNYSEAVGDWILANDDLVPAVKERIKALILGEGGLEVSPVDPDTEADRRLADHLQTRYEEEPHPDSVVETILSENLKNARAVLRSTDLQPLDLDQLTFLRDGITGNEIYWQRKHTVHTFDLDAPDDQDGISDLDDIGLEDVEVDGQPLVIGEHVLDVSLYDQPPLEAVADTVVNKKQMQRLKARKAEITSFGAIYAKVNPPDYLPEDEWFDRVEDDDGEEVTKLERALEQNLNAAFNWVKDYQSGTTGAIPMHWDLEQFQMPEGDEPLDDQIRGYNRDISRRLLVPLDLLELRDGSELSRETLMRTLLTTIQGWRQEILRVFNQFAEVQADIHDLNGSVDHGFPPLNDADVEAITQLLNFAGVLGASTDELRQMVNQIQGVDLATGDDRDQGGPGDAGTEPGGPGAPEDRQEQMDKFLREQDQATADRLSRRDVLDQLEAATFSEGDEVDTPAGMGVVVEIRTENFTGPSGDEVEASDDNPAYVVGVMEGARVYREDELEDGTIEVDLDNPEADLKEAAASMALEGQHPDTGLRFDFPPSWRKSETPSRLILLKTWARLGGRFTSCRRKMAGDVALPARFCASMKDRVLEWEGWRQGG